MSAVTQHNKRHIYTEVDENKRPVIGVLTEPLRGNLFKEREDHLDEDDLVSSYKDGTASYVPKAHVQFLGQAGIRVVPVDYRMPVEERFALMD